MYFLKKYGYRKFYSLFFWFNKKTFSKKIKDYIKNSKFWIMRQNNLLEGAKLLNKKGIKVDFDCLIKIQENIINFNKINFRNY